MSLQNLINLGFTPAEIEAIDQKLAELENLLAPKLIALTPEQRQEYGRLGNHFAPWVEKVSGYMHLKPELIPAFVSSDEFATDKSAYDVLKPMLNRLDALQVAVDDTLKLVGSDLYTNSVAYYRNIKLLAAQNVPGAKPIYEDLNTVFPSGKRKKAEETGA